MRSIYRSCFDSKLIKYKSIFFKSNNILNISEFSTQSKEQQKVLFFFWNFLTISLNNILKRPKSKVIKEKYALIKPRKLKFSKKKLKQAKSFSKFKINTSGKAKFKNLTKKQRKKIRMAKANRIIYPVSNMLLKQGAVARNITINKVSEHLKDRDLFVHDGYSWTRVLVNSSFYDNLKIGVFAHKTRPLSPIKLDSKLEGKIFKMNQPTTYKIKSVKVKRKK